MKALNQYDSATHKIYLQTNTACFHYNGMALPWAFMAQPWHGATVEAPAMAALSWPCCGPTRECNCHGAA